MGIIWPSSFLCHTDLPAGIDATGPSPSSLAFSNKLLTVTDKLFDGLIVYCAALATGVIFLNATRTTPEDSA